VRSRVTRLLRWVTDFLGDVRRASTWRVAVAIVSLSLALYIVSGGRIRGMPYSIYPFVRFWGLAIGVFGLRVLTTAIYGSRMTRLDRKAADRRELRRPKKAAALDRGSATA